MRKHQKVADVVSSYSILALDDDPTMTLTLQTYFQRSGYHVDTENDPYQAIERVRNGHYDILLLDFLMTPICGDQVVEQIRSFNQDLFIILLTGHKSMAPPIKTIRDLEIQGYYEKKRPVRPAGTSGGILHQIHQADAHHSKLPKRADQNHRDHAADLQPAWPGRGCRRACAGGKRAFGRPERVFGFTVEKPSGAAAGGADRPLFRSLHRLAAAGESGFAFPTANRAGYRSNRRKLGYRADCQ